MIQSYNDYKEYLACEIGCMPGTLSYFKSRIKQIFGNDVIGRFIHALRRYELFLAVSQRNRGGYFLLNMHHGGLEESL